MRYRLLCALAAGIFLPAAATAQSATYTHFGTGCSSPPFSVSGLPQLGATLTIQTYGSYYDFFNNYQRAVFTGFSNQSLRGLSIRS